MTYLILIYCLLYLILAIRRLDWAVMLLIAALPSYLIRFGVFGVPFTLLEVMILISFVVWFFKNYKHVLQSIKIKFQIPNSKFQIPKRYPFDVEIILLLIISFLAAGISGFSSGALGIWKAYFFEPALLFIVMLNVFKGKEGINKILRALLVSALAISLFAVYQKFTGFFIFNEFWAAAETRRATSFFSYPNAVGLYLGPIILILIGYSADKICFLKNQKIFNFSRLSGTPPRRWQFSIYKFQIIIWITILFSLISVYFAKSEGALIGVLAGLVVFGLMSNKKTRSVTMGLVVLVGAGMILYAPAREYATDKLFLRDLSGQIRKAQWTETWNMLKDGRIISGSSLANYQNAIKPYHQEGIFVRDYKDPDWHKKTVFNEEYRKKVWQPLEIYLYPHNIFLNFWAELGLAGMILFVWIITKCFILGIRNWKLGIGKRKKEYLTLGLISAMIVIIIHGLADVPYFKNDLAAMFWALLAIMGIIDLELKMKK